VEPEDLEGEYGFEEEDEYGGDDYGEEGGDEEGGDEEEAEYGDYGEEEEEFNTKIEHTTDPQMDRWFLDHVNMKDRYSTSEVETFFKLLAIKPQGNWQDESTHHHKLGIHTYEDDGQQSDPTFHILSE